MINLDIPPFLNRADQLELVDLKDLAVLVGLGLKEVVEGVEVEEILLRHLKTFLKLFLGVNLAVDKVEDPILHMKRMVQIS